MLQDLEAQSRQETFQIPQQFLELKLLRCSLFCTLTLPSRREKVWGSPLAFYHPNISLTPISSMHPKIRENESFVLSLCAYRTWELKVPSWKVSILLTSSLPWHRTESTQRKRHPFAQRHQMGCWLPCAQQGPHKPGSGAQSSHHLYLISSCLSKYIALPRHL